jgi:hypothetical protein
MKWGNLYSPNLPKRNLHRPPYQAHQTHQTHPMPNNLSESLHASSGCGCCLHCCWRREFALFKAVRTCQIHEGRGGGGGGGVTVVVWGVGGLGGWRLGCGVCAHASALARAGAHRWVGGCDGLRRGDGSTEAKGRGSKGIVYICRSWGMKWHWVTSGSSAARSSDGDEEKVISLL